MDNYTLRRMLHTLNIDAGRYDNALLDRNIAGISTDSRRIRDDEVLFAIRGERFDGIDYVDSAYESGAIFAVVNRDSPKEKKLTAPHAAVGDTIEALGAVAADYRSMFDSTVIAITGTNGKTTVKEMLLQIIGSQFLVHGTKGNFNNHIGLPLTVFGLEKEHEVAIFELGMNAPGEIGYLGRIAKPDIGMVLNAGPGHIGFFKDVGEIADAKMELLETIGKDGAAVINGDDELLMNRLDRTRSNVVTFGINGTHDYTAKNIRFDKDGCPSFTVGGQSIQLEIQGYHNVYNALAAYSIGRILNMSGSAIARDLNAFKAPKMRMERFLKDGIHYINDTYNANPVSMKVAAEVLRFMDNKRKIVVLGDMLELGEEADALHEEIGEHYAGLDLEWMCLIGDFAEVYKNAAIRGGMRSGKIKIFPDNESAAAFLNDVKRSGDAILVKGSRALRLETVIEAVSGGN